MNRMSFNDTEVRFLPFERAILFLTADVEKAFGLPRDSTELKRRSIYFKDAPRYVAEHLNRNLESLERHQARILEMRFFCDLPGNTLLITLEELADVVDTEPSSKLFRQIDAVLRFYAKAFITDFHARGEHLNYRAE